ncbi:MAG: zinc-binding dehydrogenase [Trueperaceae bacterium]|nr:zinc-binding dehydrogenase [Trueperaceae bacterium]
MHRLPDGCSWGVGALVEPLACAVHATTDLQPPCIGATCVVVGPGPLGLLVALVVRSRGARVAVVGRGRRPRRLELARALGIEQVVDIEADGALDALKRWMDGGADQVYGCAGGGDAVALGLSLVRRRGRYTELALAGGTVPIDLDTVVRHEIEIGGAVSHRPESWRLALELIASGSISTETLERLITAVYPLERWRAAFDAAAGRAEGKVLVVPHGATVASHAGSPPPR